MSGGRKRIVWALIAIMSILIAVATSAIFVGKSANSGAISNFASAETTAAPVSADGGIMPTSILVGSDNYHAEGVHDFADGGWTELMEYDVFGKFYITEEGNYFLNDIPTWVNGLEFDVGGKITLCLNGHDFDWSSEEGGLIVGPDIDLHICDCGNGSIIGDITVEGGSLELDGVNLSGGTVTVEEGSSLKVAGNTQIGSVYLGDDVTIECGELDTDADINIEVDDNSERGDPYVDADSFEANNSGDITNYFTMSDGSNPSAYRIKVVFPVIGSEEAPYKAPYGGPDSDWFRDNIKDYITFTRNSNGDEVTVGDLTLDEDYEVAISIGESEMKSVGEYVVSVSLTTDGAKKYTFIGISEADPNFESGGECNMANGVATMPYEIVKSKITVKFNPLDAVYDGETDWFLVFTEAIDEYIELDGLNVNALSLQEDFIIESEPTGDTVVSESGDMKNAGTYTISVELSSSDNANNYELAGVDDDGNSTDVMEVITHEYEVERAAVKVDWNSDVVTLAAGVFNIIKGKIVVSAGSDGIIADPENDYTVTAKAGDGTGGTYEENLNITEAGYYTFKVTLGSNFQFSTSGSFGRVNDTEATHTYTVAETINAVWKNSSKTYYYTGNNHFNDIVGNIKFTNNGGEVLSLQASDYTVTVNGGNNVTNAGEYTVTIVLHNAKYQFSNSGAKSDSSLSVTVNKVNIKVSGTYTASHEYDGKNFTVKGNIVKSGLTITYSPSGVEDTTLTVQDITTTSKNANTYSGNVVISTYNSANFNLDDSSDGRYTLTITPKVLSAGSVIWGNTNLIYSGSAQKPTAEIPTGVEGENDNIVLDVTVQEGSAIKVGGYHATAALPKSITNYTFAGATHEFKIDKATIKVSGDFNGVKTYNGAGYREEITAATASAYGLNVQSIDLSFKIIVSTVEVNCGVYTYAAGKVSVSFEYDADNFNLSEDVRYTVTINKAKIAFDKSNVSIKNSKTYDGTTSVTDVGEAGESITFDTGVNSEKANATYTALYNDKNVKSANEITVTLTLKGATNYEFGAGDGYTLNADGSITWKQSGTITAKPLSLKDGVSVTKVYDGTGAVDTDEIICPDSALDGIIGSDNVTVLTKAAVFTGSDFNVGENKGVRITVTLGGSEADNYSIGDQTLNVGKITSAHVKSIKWEVDSEAAQNTYIYNGEERTLTATGVWYFGDDEDSGEQTIELSVILSGVQNGKFKDVKTYNFTAEITGNANLTYEGGVSASFTITVNKASLTVEGLKAEKVYDATRTAEIEYTSASLKTVFGGDEVIISSVTGTYLTANVGDEIEVTVNVTLGGSAADNYEVKQFTIRGKITPAKLTVAVAEGKTIEKPYDNSLEITVNPEDLILKDKFGSDVVEIISARGVFEDKNFGENKTITLTIELGGAAAGNYTIDKQTVQGNINKATIDSLPSLGNKTYNGATQTADELATLDGVGGEELQLGRDYTVTYSADGGYSGENAVNAGTYTVTIELKSSALAQNYSVGAGATAKFTIDKAQLTIEDVEEYAYNGKDQFDKISEAIKANVKNDETTVTPETVEVQETEVKDVKTYSITVKLSEEDYKNYEFSAHSQTTSVSITVVKGEVTGIVWSVSEPAESGLDGNNYEAEYDGKEHTVTATLTLNGVAKDTVEFEFNGDIIKDAKEYTLTVTGTENYTVSADNATFTAVINRATITLPDLENATYNGGKQEADELATLNGVNHEILTLDDDYTVTYKGEVTEDDEPINADTYTVTVALKPESALAKNYTLSAPTTEYTIDKAELDRPTSTALENKVSGSYKGADYEIEISGFIDDKMTAEQSNIGKSQFTPSDDYKYKFTAKDASDTAYTLNIKIKNPENYKWADGDSGDVTFTITITKANITDDFGGDGKIAKKQEYLYHADDSKHELKLKPDDPDFPLVLQGSDKLTDEEITYIIESHSEAEHGNVDMDRRLNDDLKNSDSWQPYTVGDNNFNVNKPRHYVVYFKVEAKNGNYNVYYGYFTVLIFNEKVTITLESGSNLPDVEYGEVKHTKQSLIDSVFDMIEKVEVSAEDGSLNDATETWKAKLKNETEHDKFEFYFRTGKTVSDGVRYEVGEMLPAGQTYYLFLQYIDGDESYITFEWKIGNDVVRPGFNVIARKINITVDVEGHTYGDTDLTDKVTPQTPTRTDGKNWYGEDKAPDISSLGITYTYTLDDGGAKYFELSSNMPAGTYTVTAAYTNTNYEIVFTIDKYKVDTAKLTFTVTPPAAEYNGEGHDVDVSFGNTLKNGDELIKDIDYTVEFTEKEALVNGKPQNVGKYTVKVKLNSESSKAKNYEVITESQEFTISVGIVGKPTGDNFSGTYTGKAQGLTLGNFTYNAAAMEYETTDDSIFAIETGVFSATNAGEYTLTIRLKEGYEWAEGGNGEVEFIISIDKATLTITGAQVKTKTYDGTTTATVTGMTFTGFMGDDEGKVQFGTCVAEFASPNASNSATVNKITEVELTGEAADNYTVELENLPAITGKIEKAALTIELTATEKPYDGTTAASVTGKIILGKVGDDDVTIEAIAAHFDDANAGENKPIIVTQITIGGTAADNYTPDFEASAATLKADINKRNITITWENVDELVYNGENQMPTPKLPVDIPEADNTSAKLSVRAIVDGEHKYAGIEYTAQAVLEGESKDNYNIDFGETQNFTIAKATITLSGTYGANREYNGSAYSANVTSGGGIAASANNKLTVTVSIHIETNGANAKTYGNDDLNITYSGYDDTNYDIEDNVTYSVEIEKATITLPDLENAIYNGGKQEAEELATLNGVNHEILTLDEDYTVTYKGKVTEDNDPINADTYTVTVTLKPQSALAQNYTLSSITTEYTIDKAELDKPTSSALENKVGGSYKGTEYEITVQNFVADAMTSYLSNGDKSSFDNTTFTATDAGIYTLTISLQHPENYKWAGDESDPIFTIEISQANLSFKLSPATGEYTGAEHEVGVQFDTVNSEKLTKDTHYKIEITNNTGAFGSNGKPQGAGDYTVTITLQGDAENNYKLEESTATYTINKAELTIVGAKVETKTYDGTTNATVTEITFTGYKGDDEGKVEFDTCVAAFTSPNVSNSATVNITEVTLKGEAAGNYTVKTPHTVNGRIDKANLTVTVSDNDKPYNGVTQGANVTVTGINGAPLTTDFSVTYKLNGTGDNVNPRDVGVYHIYITLSGDNALNYNEVTVEDEFTISPVTVGVVWNGGEEINFTYDGNIKTITAEATGVSGEPVNLVISYVSNTHGVNLVAGEPLNAGEYTATASTSNGNYNLSGDTITFTVAKQQVTAPTIASKVYNGTLQTAHVETSALYDVTENDGGINADSYEVKLTLKHPENYKWSDVETAEIVLTFTILKADYDMSGVTFGAVTVDYDGKEHSILICGDLPDGVTVTYEGNGQTAVGEYTVTAIFTGDAHNYNAITPMTAKLTILRVSHNLSEIAFEDVTVKYDGEAHSIYVDESALPHGVTVTYEGNGQTDPDVYTVTAIFSDHIGEFERKTATLTILRLHTQTDDSEAVIDSEDGFDPTLELVVEKIEDVERSYWAWKKDVVSDKYAVKLCKDGVEVPIEGKVTVRILIPEQFRDKNFELKAVARATSVEYTRDGDYVVFEADGLSAYVFTSSYTPYFPIVFITTGVMLADVLVLVALAVILKKKRSTKEK